MTAIVFDLDGTLIDSAPDIHAAAARMLAGEGLAPLPLATIQSFIGNGVAVLVQRMMETVGLPEADHPRLTTAFVAHYEAAPAVLTRPFPHVRETLAALHGAGARLGLCTNKPAAPSRAILAAFDLDPFFATVIGGDSLPTRKPDPAGLLCAFAELGGVGLYVGDSEIDAETAHRAGAPFALFTEGYRKTPVEALTHHFAFADFASLPALCADFFAQAERGLGTEARSHLG